jgi:23S rRNA (uracil1939-C5)-methyltransferase
VSVRGLAPGDRIEVTVEKGVYRGLGLARHEGQVVFVPRTFPSDRVRVRVETARSGYVEGRSEAIVHASADRRASPCPYVPRCGGCAYQELDYAAQLRLKEDVLRESLRRAGAPWDSEIGVRGSPEEGWRMRASLHVQSLHGEVKLGLHEEGTRRVVDLERCLQLSAAMNTAARGLRRALEERPDLARHVRGIDLLESPEGGALVAALETDLPAAEATKLGALAEGAPALTGFGAATLRPKHFVLLRGDAHVASRVGELALRAHVSSFFQGNRFLYEELARTVVDLVPPSGPVLDLYAGVGLFALPLAAKASDVVAVETSPTAADDAEANVAAARLSNVRVVRADVGEALSRRRGAGDDERIVLDPPRTGAGAPVPALVAERRPRAIVYVSCDPPTLGRDLAAFARHGYRPDRVTAFDLFPDTYHLETVVRLVAG